MLQRLKERVCRANIALKTEGLITLTWGNVSELDRATGYVAIKPSGVSYDALTPDDIVIVDLNGNKIEAISPPRRIPRRIWSCTAASRASAASRTPTRASRRSLLNAAGASLRSARHTPMPSTVTYPVPVR